MVKKILVLFYNSFKNGTFFRDFYHLLRYKKITLKDLVVRLKKITFQRRLIKIVNKSGIDFFYTDEFLINKTKYNDIESLLKKIELRNINFFPKNIFKVNNEIIDQAEKFCKHKFNLLGSGEIKVCYGMEANGIEKIKFPVDNKAFGTSEFLPDDYELIDWFIDFKSGYRWNSNNFYKNIQSSNLSGVDIKIPWELSRCQHFGILSQAYTLSKNEKYANEIKHQITDWINNNKFGYGPNWVCAMDVGIRVSNWFVSLELIKDSNAIRDKNFLKLFAKSVNHHYEYLLNNLEWNSNLTSNHYLSDIVGLYFISNYFPHFIKSSQMKIKFIKEIEREIFKQTYPDGMNSEGSTSYHRLVLELFAYSALLDKKENNFSKKFYERLFKMFEFSFKTMKKNGDAPQIGDNDSGVFLTLSSSKLNNHLYLLELAKKIFKTEKFNVLEENFSEEFNFLKESGICVYRDKEIYFLLSNGPNGQNGNGGHCHNDKLSFILDYQCNEMFIDPGTYLYTPFPKKRNTFRSTSSHNTVSVDNKEQNQFIEKYLFGMVENCTSMISNFNLTSDGFIFEGSHNGYERINNLIHQRRIDFNKSKKTFNIKDSFDNHEKTMTAHFIIPKKMFLKIENNRLHLQKGMVEFDNCLSISKISYFSSKGYGLKDENCFQINVLFNQYLDTRITFQ